MHRFATALLPWADAAPLAAASHAGAAAGQAADACQADHRCGARLGLSPESMASACLRQATRKRGRVSA